ncbi:MAG: SMP-30/gluconolactonase/LRE family protein [Burkholderiales bacterium]|nr:SMP-30/gluconolactonase/LRE family protein [Burkholderiales bacterium]
MADTRVTPESLRFTGKGLMRPECVLATESGYLYTADWRGGVAATCPDGTHVLYRGELPGNRPLRPNGIALRRDGSFLMADLGDTLGGVFMLDRAGTVRPFLEEVDGIPLPPSNFVFEDAVGRVWITVSTRKVPRAADYRPDAASGFVVLADAAGARIVADGLGYTNEAVVSPDGTHLYVNETFARRLTRFRIGADGTLRARETVATFGKGTFPDGMTFDSQGGIWITSIVSNRVIHVAPDGAQTVVLEDADPAHIDWVEDAFQAGTMGRPHLDKAAGRVLRNISSLAFGGPDLRTAYLGCLLGDSLAWFRAPVAGHPPVHWRH